MHHLALLLSLTIGSLALPACTRKAQAPQTAATPKTTVVAADSQEAGPVLTFQRTPCFGTCPGYSMKVYADGRVEYEGTRAVPLMGQRELQLPPATVAGMLRQAQQAHFDQFKDTYLSGASDLPTTIIAIRQPNGELKTVVAENNAPANVREFFNTLTMQFDMLAQLTMDR